MSRPGPGAPGDERLRVLLAQPDARGRLRVMSALGGRYDLVPLAPDEDPLRAVRSHRPALVLLEVPRGRSQNTMRACRAIKTDAGAPPRVALLDPQGRLTDPRAFLEACLADGYLGLELDDEDLRAFVREVLAGQRPVREGPPRRRGLLSRLFER